MKKVPYSLYEFIVLSVFLGIEAISYVYLGDNYWAMVFITVLLVGIAFYLIGDMESNRKIQEFQEKYGIDSFELAQQDYWDICYDAKFKHISFTEAEFQFFTKISK